MNLMIWTIGGFVTSYFFCGLAEKYGFPSEFGLLVGIALLVIVRVVFYGSL